MLHIAAEAGTSAIKFFIAIFVAGFLFSPAPGLVDSLRMFSRELASGRGEEFVQLAGATIRAVSRGVIGISALQAFLAGLGLMVAGIPGASLITSAVLILGIILRSIVMGRGLHFDRSYRRDYFLRDQRAIPWPHRSCSDLGIVGSLGEG